MVSFMEAPERKKKRCKAYQHEADQFIQVCGLASHQSGVVFILELLGMQAGVGSVRDQQFGMGATLDDTALLHHEDKVSLLDGAQAMSDDQDRKSTRLNSSHV